MRTLRAENYWTPAKILKLGYNFYYFKTTYIIISHIKKQVAQPTSPDKMKLC